MPRRRIPLDLSPPVGKTVACEELTHAPRIRRVAGADHLEAAAEADQQLPPREVSAQQQVAEPRVLKDQRAQALNGDDQDFARLPDDRREEGRLTREQAQLAEKPAGAVHRDDALLGVFVGVYRSDLSGQHNAEVVIDVAFAKQDLPQVGRPDLSVGLQPRDLLLRQPRIRAVPVRRLEDLLVGVRRSTLPRTGPRRTHTASMFSS